MKVLLTGGSGFLGKSFYEKYKGRYDIAAPRADQLDLTVVREVVDYFKEHRFDAVLHCASVPENEAGAVDNLIMFKNIQYAAIIGGVKKLLIAGDVAEFDRSKPIVSIEESTFGQSIPQDTYGLGRYLINLLASKDKISTNLRFFNVYGPGSYAEQNIMSALSARGVLGKDIELPHDRRLGVIYIDDAVKVMAAFLDNDFPKGDYNVVADKSVTLQEAAACVKRAAKRDGKNIRVTIGETVAPECTGSNAKLLSVLPTLKFTAFTTGMNKTYQYLDMHKGMCRKRRK
ncbi:MAG: NAD-dependent epimerase/dehydratase family protein [Clostridia bacterium]|nr:NAD-dependent epimerase/dehydratase family protein [Clostridia bacterium]